MSDAAQSNNAVVVEHVPSEGVGGYTIVVTDPSDAWRQDNGKPGYAEWAIYEIEGREGSDGQGPRLYWKKGEASNMPGTTDIAEAEAEADGSVKWDGCCNFQTGATSMAHVCDTEDMTNYTEALRRAYALALEMVGGGLD